MPTLSPTACPSAMDLKTFALVCGTLFMAELGEQTPLARILYAAEGRMSRCSVLASRRRGARG